MEPIAPLITLDEITNGYLDQHQMPQSKYRRIYSIAIRGFRLFYRDSTGIPKTVTLPVLGNGTSVLPTDAMNKIAIGVLNQRGEIASLVYDPLLALTDTTSPNREQQPTEHLLVNNDDILFALQDGNNIGYVGYGGYGQLGVGSQPVIGYYNIDWANRVIVYNFHFKPTEVIFSYLGIPDVDGDYAIHPFFQEALIAYINWQNSVGDVKKQYREINKRDYDIAYNNARKAMAPFDPSDMYNVNRQGARLAPKS